MELTHIIAFNIALLAAVASPGPALLIAIKTTLSSGRRAGISIGIGLALIASLWTLAALVGLEVLFLAFPWAFLLAKTAGALYLLYIAYAMWKTASKPIETRIKPASHAFRQGIMINLLNPKSVLFASAVLVVIFPSGMSMGENLAIAVNHFVLEIAFYTICAFAMSNHVIRQGYMRAKIYIDRTAAGILSILGLKLLFSK